MPRRARIVAGGDPIRGIDRAAIFLSEADDRAFLAASAALAATESVRAHAYVGTDRTIYAAFSRSIRS